MALSLCFTQRFVRLLDELEIDPFFLKKELEKSLSVIKKRFKCNRVFFDTHGNLKCSCYVCWPMSGLIKIITYSVDDCCLSRKRKNFLKDLWHELRHFQQDKIYKMDMDEYSLKDMNEINTKYYNSKIEKDARKYEKRFINVYKRLRKFCYSKDTKFQGCKENKIPNQKNKHPKTNSTKN